LSRRIKKRRKNKFKAGRKIKGRGTRFYLEDILLMVVTCLH
jgi:hypothetical protein